MAHIVENPVAQLSAEEVEQFTQSVLNEHVNKFGFKLNRNNELVIKVNPDMSASVELVRKDDLPEETTVVTEQAKPAEKVEPVVKKASKLFTSPAKVEAAEPTSSKALEVNTDDL